MRKTITKADKQPKGLKGIKEKKHQKPEEEELNPEQVAFNNIFGSKGDPGNLEVASTVLEEFVAMFPEAASSGKATARRGDVKLTKYVDSQGSRKSTAAVNRAPLWDNGLFVGKMATLRPKWTPERVQREWDLIGASALPVPSLALPPLAPARVKVEPSRVGDDRIALG